MAKKDEGVVLGLISTLMTIPVSIGLWFFTAMVGADIWGWYFASSFDIPILLRYEPWLGVSLLTGLFTPVAYISSERFLASKELSTAEELVVPWANLFTRLFVIAMTWFWAWAFSGLAG